MKVLLPSLSGASALLHRAIASAIQRRLSSPWTPPYCRTSGMCLRGDPPAWQREVCLALIV